MGNIRGVVGNVKWYCCNIGNEIYELGASQLNVRWGVGIFQIIYCEKITILPIVKTGNTTVLPDGRIVSYKRPHLLLVGAECGPDTNQ
jgi:hypothetical protein